MNDKPKPTAAELAGLRQLAAGVIYECERATFGAAPRPRSIKPAVALAALWLAAAALMVCAVLNIPAK